MPLFAETIRERWMLRLMEAGELDLKAEARLLAAEIANDPELLDRYVAEQLAPTVRAIGENTVKRLPDVQRIGGSVETMDHLQARVRAEASRVTWIEYEPSLQAYLPLVEMTREQVTRAAMHRAALANESAEISRWFLLLADRLESPHDTVGTVLTPDEIIALRGVAAEQAQALPHTTRKV